MDIHKFAHWLKNEFDFDCFQNDFFEKALYSTQNDFENSTFNDIPFEVYYADALHKTFLYNYLSRLQWLLQSIPAPNSQVSLTIQGVHLNAYCNRIEELQSSIRLLNS